MEPYTRRFAAVVGDAAATGSVLERFESLRSGALLDDEGVGAPSSLSMSSSLMSSSLGRMDAKASGLEKDGAVSNDILLDELRLSALRAAEGGLREKPSGGGLLNEEAAGGGEVLAWAAVVVAEVEGCETF